MAQNIAASLFVDGIPVLGKEWHFHEFKVYQFYHIWL